jgi:anti-anti-sigma factor
VSTFQATVVAGSDPAQLQVSGDLDLASADQLLTTATTAAGSGTSLAMDLSGVTFIDSTGLGVLIKVKNSLVARGGDLELTATSLQVDRVMTLTGLADVFGVRPQDEK